MTSTPLLVLIAGPYRSGTGDDPDDLGSAPDPADADLASDEYPERPRTPGLTSDDSGA